MNPLKVKASGSPITSANISGLQTMTDSEVKNYIANVITEKFAAVTDGTGTAEINITTDNSGSGTSIGSFVDTNRTESIGTHPATGNTTTTTYYAKQVTAAASESITNRPLAWDSHLEEMSDGDIDGVLDLCIEAMVAESSYTAGQYKLQASAPSGGTWVSRYTLTDTAQGGNTVTYLWQKTVASSSPNSDYTPLRSYNGSNCKQMTESEIEQLLPNFRNRIIDTGIGTYKLQSSAPSGGTWVQMGNEFSDTREQVSPQNYAGNYSGNFTGNYSGNYGGVVNYSGTYSNTFSTTSNYTGNFSGNYAGTAGYSNTFTNAVSYTGTTYTAPLGPLISYSGTYTGSPFYSPFFSGPGPSYTGNYASYYSGSRNYAGNYAGTGATYSGVAYYSGSRNYAGSYAGTATYTGNYSGAPGPGYTGAFMADYYTGYYSGTNYYTDYFSNQIPDPYSGLQTVYYSPGFFTGPGPAYSGSYQETQFIPGIGYLPVFYTNTFSSPGGTFTGNYVGPATYSGSRTYSGNYAGTGPGYTGIAYYSGSRTYNGTYVSNFAGNYSGTVSFQGPAYGTSYTGNYNGFVPPTPYTGYFSGPGGFYTGYFTGPANYSGNYQGTFSTTSNYTGNFSGNYAGGGTYTGNYSGSYINTFTGNYSGATIQATKDTVSTIKLWIRTA
jgi:hypothetical protein